MFQKDNEKEGRREGKNTLSVAGYDKLHKRKVSIFTAVQIIICYISTIPVYPH
jgi:hypothetical protein